MPKRVADGGRTHSHTNTCTDNHSIQIDQNQSCETSNTRATTRRTTMMSTNVTQRKPQTPSLNPRLRAVRDNSKSCSPFMAPEGTIDNSASPMVITTSIAPANNTSLPISSVEQPILLKDSIASQIRNMNANLQN